MPTQKIILGFSNRCYAPAIHGASRIEIEKDLVIALISPPYFLATKFRTFKGLRDCGK